MANSLRSSFYIWFPVQWWLLSKSLRQQQGMWFWVGPWHTLIIYITVHNSLWKMSDVQAFSLVCYLGPLLWRSEFFSTTYRGGAPVSHWWVYRTIHNWPHDDETVGVSSGYTGSVPQDLVLGAFAVSSIRVLFRGLPLKLLGHGLTRSGCCLSA